MSSFRDQFSKDEKKSQVLDYDNSAAKFFVGAVASIVLSIWSFYLLSTLCARTLCAKKEDANATDSTKKKLKNQKKQEVSMFWIVLQVSIRSLSDHRSGDLLVFRCRNVERCHARS